MDDMIKPNFEKKTGLWLGLLVLVLSIIYILTTLGKATWTSYIAIVFGYFLVGFLIIEGGVLEYFRRKDYKKIGVGDFVVWITIASASVIFLNTTLLIQAVRNITPDNILNPLLSFTQITGVTAGIVGAILGIVYIAYSRFR